MPSAAVLTEGRWRVGQAALNSRRTHPDTFVGSPKARLGQEPVLLGGDLVEPAAIASHVLAAVRERAVRAAGGTDPDRLVLTHPVRWGRTRLDALQEAARLAGFATETIGLLPEPIAALHAYVTPGTLPPGSRVAVVDIGGGTCDVAVLQTTDDPAPGRDLLVVAQEGDDRLGGNDLDDLLYRWVLTQLAASGRTDMVAALSDPAHLGAALTLLDVVRSAKQDLSEHTNAPVGVAVAGQEATVTVTREEYEGLIAEPMSRAGSLAARALAASGTTRLAGLYLTGGTAYTPALSRALHQATGIMTAPIGDPKLAVAVGALKTPVAVMSAAELAALAQRLRQQRPWAQAASPSPAPPAAPSAPAPQPFAPYPTPPQPSPAPPAAPQLSAAAPGTPSRSASPTSPYTTVPATSSPYDAPAPAYGTPSAAPSYASTPAYATGPAYTQDLAGGKRSHGVAITAVVAALVVVVAVITGAVLLLRSGGTPTASSPASAASADPTDTPSTPTSTPTTPTSTPSTTAPDNGTITATTPPGYPELNPSDFSADYCSLWSSTIGPSASPRPDSSTAEGAAAHVDAYTQLEAIAPTDATMYLDTLIQFYTLAVDAYDSSSATHVQSANAALAMSDLFYNTDMMLEDATMAACLF